MVKFISIRIQDYKSVGDVTIQFEPGIYKVVGESQGYSSNGAGKTSITQAIVLGLYNKDFTSAKLDELSNRVTGRGFVITIHLIKDGVPYVIVNNRHTRKFTVHSMDEKVVSGVKDSVLFVTKLLGMGYDTFCLTHFITSRTVNHITENLSNPTLFNDILQISQLKELDKRVMQYRQVVEEKIKELDQEFSQAKSMESRQTIQDKYDLRALNEELGTLKESYRQKILAHSLEQSQYQLDIGELEDKILPAQRKLEDIKNIINSGVCPTCSSLLVQKSALDELKQEAGFLQEVVDKHTPAYLQAKKDWKLRDNVLSKEEKDVKEEIRDIETSITIAQEISLMYSEIAGRSSEEVMKELKPRKHMSALLQFIRSSIKDGVIVKSLLSTFFEIVQIKMNDYSALINMNGTDVKITVNKLGMGIALTKDGEFTPVSTLSNGEKTRLSILLLVSMLDAMKEVSNSETNYLVFDEASASFDASGVTELEQLFNYMKELGQSSFVITHGSEMDKVAFDHILLIRKEEGITYV